MNIVDVEQSNRELRSALQHIKQHIGSTGSAQDIDLHNAVQLIVTVARRNGLLLDGGAK